MTVRNPFDPRGRERYQSRMNQAGYVEFKIFTATKFNYCCLNCPYMKEEQTSPTGYWCKLLSFPDSPEGCCNLWEPFPEVAKIQERSVQ